MPSFLMARLMSPGPLLEGVRPLPCTVQDPQYLYPAELDAVGRNIRSADYHQFPGPLDSARSPLQMVFVQTGDLGFDFIPLLNSGLRIVFGNKVNNRSKITFGNR